MLLKEYCKKKSRNAVNGVYNLIRFISTSMKTTHQTDWSTDNQTDGNSTDNLRPVVRAHRECPKNSLSDFSQLFPFVNIAIFWDRITWDLMEVYGRFRGSWSFIIRLADVRCSSHKSIHCFQTTYIHIVGGFQIMTLRICLQKQAGLD